MTIHFLLVLVAGSLRSRVAGLVSFEAFFLGLQMTIFSLCPHMIYMIFALFVTTFPVSLWVSKFPLLMKTPIRLD